MEYIRCGDPLLLSNVQGSLVLLMSIRKGKQLMLTFNCRHRRNNASVARPNEELRDAPEAMLAVNTARSILHYVDARLRV